MNFERTELKLLYPAIFYPVGLRQSFQLSFIVHFFPTCKTACLTWTKRGTEQKGSNPDMNLVCSTQPLYNHVPYTNWTAELQWEISRRFAEMVNWKTTRALENVLKSRPLISADTTAALKMLEHKFCYVVLLYYSGSENYMTSETILLDLVGTIWY